MEYLLVDGYNIINAWPELSEMLKDNLEDARWKLIEILLNYQGYTKEKIILVFDAHLVKGSRETCERYDRIDVIFTKENESADHYIERFVHHYIDKSHKIRVATSDFLEQTIVLSKGAIRISAKELYLEIMNTKKNMQEKTEEKTIKRNTISARLEGNTLKALENLRRRKF